MAYGLTESNAPEMGFLMFLAIFGNALLMLIIIRGNSVSKRRVSPVQLLLLHTCIADLLFAFLSMGTGILELEVIHEYDFSKWICPVMKVWQAFPLYASPYLLVAISADRFQAICRPLAHYRANRYRMPNILAAIAWGLAFICALPQAYIWERRLYLDRTTNLTVPRNITLCRYRWQGESEAKLRTAKVVSTLGFSITAWLLPSIIASIFYYRVCKAVWSSRVTDPSQEATAQQKASNSNLKNLQTKCYVDGLRKSTLHRQISEFDRKRMQTVRLTLTIVACNFLLYAPFTIANVIQSANEKLLNVELVSYCMILGNLNSCINPWIYILFNKSHVKRALCMSALPNGHTYSRYSENAKTESFKRSATTNSSRKGTVNDYGIPPAKPKRSSMRDDLLQPKSGSTSSAKDETDPLIRTKSLRPARL